MTQAILHTDGGSRGNPGPAAGGVVLLGTDGSTIHESGHFFGRCTNNVAEYRALLAGIEAAATQQITDLRIRLDSELIVKQLKREYRVKSPDLKPLYEEAVTALQSFAQWEVQHVPRAKNSRADALANQAMDQKQDVEGDGRPSSSSVSSPKLVGWIEGKGPACPLGQSADVPMRLLPLVEEGWCLHAVEAVVRDGAGGASGACARCGAKITTEPR